MSAELVIMLVDDNKIDIFIHGEVIKRIPSVKELISYTFAGDALAYLEETAAEKWPHVILLDIHMPIMNGFDFLLRYEKLPAAARAGCRVVVVSSTLDSGDLKSARTNPEVFAFLEKPINPDKLKALLSTAGSGK